MSSDRIYALKQLRANMQDAHDRLSVEVDNQIMLHAAPSCRALCEEMQRALPRELRDMIYQSLLPPQDILIEPTDFLPVAAIHSSRPKLVDTPHLIAPEYSDPITRQELVEAWYKLSTFQFASNDLMPQFLHKDLWGLDLPVRQLVRRLEIDMWPIEDDIYSRAYMMNKKRYRSQPELLDCLLAIRPGAEMIFSVNTTNYNNILKLDCRRQREYVESLRGYFSPVKQLLAAGHKVIANLSIGLEVEVTEDDLVWSVWIRRLSRMHEVSWSAYV
jgi:hypothetical protein